MSKLLEVEDLHITLQSFDSEVKAVDGISFHVDHAETVGIVGESGSGKSMTAQAIMKLIPSPPLKKLEGQIFFHKENISLKSDKQMEKIRGKEIGMIFQDPLTSLNPTMKIGRHIMEGIIRHNNVTKKEAYNQALQLLNDVEISYPEKRLEQYPFELSGGMRQRVMIAMALACSPSLLIADEPTTALDVTIQAQILDLLQNLKTKQHMALLLITHNLSIVAGMCDRVIVMKAGKIVETGTVEDIFYHPKHPYTISLLEAVPNPKWAHNYV